MIHLLYSADFELYLGGNFLTEEQVLLQPTHALLERAETLGIPFTLFVDMTCLWRYREWGEEAFVQAVEAFLVDAASRGHDLQCHLHPHWQSAERLPGGAFRVNPGDYALGGWGKDAAGTAAFTEKLARRARDHLEGLIQPHDPGYRCRAFRAGGYALEPHAQGVMEGLLAAGFLIDSSIVPGYLHQSLYQEVDHRAVPKRSNWFIHPDHGPFVPAHQGLFEIPLAGVQLEARRARWVFRPAAARQALRILSGREQAPLARGAPLGFLPLPVALAKAEASRFKRAWWRYNALMDRRFLRLELSLEPAEMWACLEGWLAGLEEEVGMGAGDGLSVNDVSEGGETGAVGPGEQFVALNCHPKGLGPAHLDALARFHHGLKKRFGAAIDHPTFAQVAQRLETGQAGGAGQTGQVGQTAQAGQAEIRSVGRIRAATDV